MASKSASPESSGRAENVSGDGSTPVSNKLQGISGDCSTPTSNKLQGSTPFTPHRSGTIDTAETSEYDSLFGRDSTQSPIEINQGDDGDPEDYHRDPGEVNIHQFYPVLDHTFNRAQSAKKEKDKDALLAILEEDSRSEQTAEGSSESRTEQLQSGYGEQSEMQGGEDEREVEGKSDTVDGGGTDTHTTIDGTASEHSESTSTQAGVFTTAVDEDAIEAARLRSQGFFSTENWQGRGQQKKIGLLRIVTERAYEHYQRAMEMKEDKNIVGIITCLNKAINLKTDDPVFYVERAEAYIQLCDFQSAILNYKKACLLESENQMFYSRLAFLYYFHGQTLFDQRLYPEALESFSRASEMVPENIGYHIRSITCLAALQRHGECLALVNKRLETDHDNPDLYIMRARLHEMFRNTTLCYYDVKDALVLDPDHAEGKAMMDGIVKRANTNKLQCMQLNIAGKHREALQKISIAIEMNPSVADFHVLRGALQRKLNDFNAAIDDFLLALDKCDHNEEDPVYKNSQRQLLLTYNDFAVECFNKGFYEEAIILLNKAIKGEKNEKSLYVNRGDCFFKQSELNFALQDYQQALELDPLDLAIKSRISVIHNEFGVGLYQEKNYPDAEAKFTLALQYNPQVGQYYISRSRARYMMENMTGAREDLLLGLLLAPTNEDVMSILSRLFPGKSVADVIGSPAAQAAQIRLNNLVSTNSPVKLSPITHSHTYETTEAYSDIQEGSSQFGVGPTDKFSSWEPPASSSGFALCIEEKKFFEEQVHEKKKVELKVKDALVNRKSLRHNGARIQPLPPPSSNTRYGTYQGHRQILAAASVGKKKLKKGSTNWRTFSLGIGGIQNV